MPLELGSALKIEREPVDDPEIRIQALESIYMITLQVRLNFLFCFPLSPFLLVLWTSQDI